MKGWIDIEEDEDFGLDERLEDLAGTLTRGLQTSKKLASTQSSRTGAAVAVIIELAIQSVRQTVAAVTAADKARMDANKRLEKIEMTVGNPQLQLLVAFGMRVSDVIHQAAVVADNVKCDTELVTQSLRKLEELAISYAKEPIRRDVTEQQHKEYEALLEVTSSNLARLQFVLQRLVKDATKTCLSPGTDARRMQTEAEITDSIDEVSQLSAHIALLQREGEQHVKNMEKLSSRGVAARRSAGKLCDEYIVRLMKEARDNFSETMRVAAENYAEERDDLMRTATAHMRAHRDSVWRIVQRVQQRVATGEEDVDLLAQVDAVKRGDAAARRRAKAEHDAKERAAVKPLLLQMQTAAERLQRK